MLNESSTSKRWFELFVQLLVVYSICTLPGIGIDRGRLASRGQHLLPVERRCLAGFLAEYLFRWYHAKDRLRYPFTLLAMIDLMAILPFFVEFAIDLRSLKLIRILRILRLFKLYRYNQRCST